MTDSVSTFDSAGYISGEYIFTRGEDAYLHVPETGEDIETAFSEAELHALVSIVNGGKKLRVILLRAGAKSIVEYLNFYIPFSHNLAERDSTSEHLVSLAMRIRLLLDYIGRMDLHSYKCELNEEGGAVIVGPGGTIIIVRERDVRNENSIKGATYSNPADLEELRSDVLVIRSRFVKGNRTIAEELHRYMNMICEFAGEA